MIELGSRAHMVQPPTINNDVPQYITAQEIMAFKFLLSSLVLIIMSDRVHIYTFIENKSISCRLIWTHTYVLLNFLFEDKKKTIIDTVPVFVIDIHD